VIDWNDDLEVMKQIAAWVKQTCSSMWRSAYKSLVLSWCGFTGLFLLWVFATPPFPHPPKATVVITKAYDLEGRQVTRNEWIERAQRFN
jgi:hypothetical protein